MYGAVLAASLLLLQQVLCLDVVYPGSATFVDDAAEFNGAPHENYPSVHPDAIFFAHSPQDVVASCSAIASTSRRIPMRSGRHSYASWAQTTPNSSTIDVSSLTSVGGFYHIEGNAYSVTIGAGWRLFDLYDNLANSSLNSAGKSFIFPGGTCPTVGISGFVLGGGQGIFGRMFGLGAQNLLGAEMVSFANAASPHLAAATDEELWALRGGGNNFGAVTSLTLKVYEVTNDLAVASMSIKYPWSTCNSSIWERYESVAAFAERRLYLQMDYYGGSCSITATLFNSTNVSEVHHLVRRQGWLDFPGAEPQPIRCGSLIDDILANAQCANLSDCRVRTKTEFPDPRNPRRFGAFSMYVKKSLFTAATPAQRARIFDAIHAEHQSFVLLSFDPYGGAINDTSQYSSVPLSGAYSFPHYDALYHIQILAYWTNTTEEPAAWDWIENVFAAIDDIQRTGGHARGSYRNYPSRRLPNAMSRYFGDSLPALAAVARRADPLQLFTYDQGLG